MNCFCLDKIIASLLEWERQDLKARMIEDFAKVKNNNEYLASVSQSYHNLHKVNTSEYDKVRSAIGLTRSTYNISGGLIDDEKR